MKYTIKLLRQNREYDYPDQPEPTGELLDYVSEITILLEGELHHLRLTTPLAVYDIANRNNDLGFLEKMVKYTLVKNMMSHLEKKIFKGLDY